MRVLAADTETTGLPNFRLPADDLSQPRMIQIAAKLYDVERQCARSLVSLIKPDGWEMDDVLAEKLGNGLIHSRLEAEGRPVAEVLAEYSAMVDEADLFVAYGCAFDLKILRGELRRAGLPDRYGDLPNFCVQRAATKACKLPPTAAMAAKNMRFNKTPNLAEAVRCLLDWEMGEAAHDALADLDATVDLLWWMIANGHGPKWGVEP